MKTKLIYSKGTKTIRLMPQNYWIASVRDGELIFDSWDGQAKKRVKNPFFKLRVLLFFLFKI